MSPTLVTSTKSRSTRTKHKELLSVCSKAVAKLKKRGTKNTGNCKTFCVICKRKSTGNCKAFCVKCKRKNRQLPSFFALHANAINT